MILDLFWLLAQWWHWSKLSTHISEWWSKEENITITQLHSSGEQGNRVPAAVCAPWRSWGSLMGVTDSYWPPGTGRPHKSHRTTGTGVRSTRLVLVYCCPGRQSTARTGLLSWPEAQVRHCSETCGEQQVEQRRLPYLPSSMDRAGHTRDWQPAGADSWCHWQSDRCPPNSAFTVLREWGLEGWQNRAIIPGI